MAQKCTLLVFPLTLAEQFKTLLYARPRMSGESGQLCKEIWTRSQG